jgi:Concanavalin A-like lectin/glucanases superfamily
LLKPLFIAWASREITNVKTLFTVPHRLLIVAATLLLGACAGGGATTTQNPNLSSNAQAATYTGPAPATSDVEAFETNLWVNIAFPVNGGPPCGNCHKAGGQVPEFARTDDINQAYAAALTVVTLSAPSQSTMVQKVLGGHNCWLSSTQACADILTTWITNWAGGGAAAGGTQIALTPPPLQTVVSSKIFPTDPTLFSQTVYPVVTAWCARCHSDTAASPQQPFFASSNLALAYQYAQAEINLNNTTQSMFYIRLAQQSHNCWGNPVSCPNSAATMLTALNAFAAGVPITPVDPTLITSGALTLNQGVVASGANRYDAHDIAKWTFKEGSGLTAFDTSGIDPAMDLTLQGQVSWDSNWGITIVSGGSAQATTQTSTKLLNRISVSGQYSVEAWINPNNVTQTKAYVVSYSGSDTTRNFTVAQDAMQYEGFNRSTSTSLNGQPTLMTNANGMFAQAALTHVVMTYDPTNGRRFYVNGNFTGDTDTVTGGALNNWDSTFAFLIGNEVSGDHPWAGDVRFVAVHDIALTQQQVQQNYAAGVGASYFLLFDVSALTGTSQSYVMFTASQYDNYSYLFYRPTFINLNAAYIPSSIPIQGIRIGVNGTEVNVDQAYIPVNVTINSSTYSATNGQLISPIGTVIPLQNGPTSDQFFLTFAQIGTNTHTYTTPTPTAPAPVTLAPVSDIGLRIYDEINTTMSEQTGVSVLNTGVNTTYQSVIQSLPPVYNILSANSAGNIATTQLAMQYCQALVNDPVLGPQFFPGMNFSSSPSQAFSTDAGMDLVITPLINNLIDANLASQPSDSQVRTELYSLISTLSTSNSANTTPVITMAACTAILSSATMSLK